MEGKGKQLARKATPTSSQQTLQESVVLCVVYKQKGVKWKELTDTVTYFIAKDSLPIYVYGWENVIFIIKSSYELRSMLLRGACTSATPVVCM